MQNKFLDHLTTGSTTVCRAWLVVRQDGRKLGFTDHDEALVIDEVEYSPQSGLTAENIEQTLGMAVNNTEVTGALSDMSLSENDIMAGRYDGAEITSYLINWKVPSERIVLLKATFGDITRLQGVFRVELRGQTEPLNIERGRVYHPECSASLGSSECKIDLSGENYTAIMPIMRVLNGSQVQVESSAVFQSGWFSNGAAKIMSGEAIGLSERIRYDESDGSTRNICLWKMFGRPPEVGDELQLTVGCDKRASVCRGKFNNFANFRGFPHIPGDDWLIAGPNARGQK